MELEAQCRARLGRAVSEGKTRLETDALAFRGDFRLSIRLKEIKSAEPKGGRLSVNSGLKRLKPLRAYLKGNGARAMAILAPT